MSSVLEDFDVNFTAKVVRCSACGDIHQDMTFEPLGESVSIRGDQYTHQGLCPYTRIVLYMRLMPVVTNL